MTNFKRTTADTQNETRENIMIRQGKKAFFVTCNLFSATCLALLLAPSAALAQNECGGDPVLDIGDDTYNCPDASYPDGVTYDADGNLAVNFTNGGVTEVESGGIDLTATGTDDITFDSQATTTEIESRAVTGSLLSVTTADGNIDIDTEEMDADGQTPDNVTHAIYAESTGSGSININTTGNVDAASTTNPSDSIGIEAITGSGSLSVTASGAVSGNDAAIDATTGTGLLTIDIANGSGTIGSGFSSVGIRTDAGGDAAINIASGRMVRGSLVLDLAAAGQTTVTNNGAITTTNNAIQGSGGSVVLNNNDTITGGINLSGLSNGYTFNNNAGAIWDVDGSLGRSVVVSNLGAGTVNNAGTILFEMDDSFRLADPVMAPDADYTGNDGVLEFVVSPGVTGQTDCTSPTVSGCLYLEGGSTAGTTLVRVVFLEAPGQESPAAANTGIVLVDVGGGSSAAGHFALDPGSIQVVTDLAPTGGVDSVNIPVYAEDPVYGAVLDLGGVLDYALLYNPDNRQHVLATVPQREGVEYVSFIHEALSVWHTTSEAVAGRQSALRDGGERGAWFRIIGEQTSRESSPTFSDHGNDFTYEQDYSLWTGAAIAGFDMTASDEHVFGFHIGYVSANADYEDGSSTTDDTIGATAGVYGGWWRNGLTFDGTINANLLNLDHGFGSNPKDLEESDSSIQTLGARLEAGFQAPILGERLYLQPLAAVSYASADIKDLELRDNDLSFEDAKSLRIGIGMRVGGDLAAADGAGKLGYWLTARRWEEREGSGRVLFEVRDGADLAVRDDLSGAFNEIDLGVNWGNADGDLSGYISGGAKFDKDDNNDSYNFSVGIRKNW